MGRFTGSARLMALCVSRTHDAVDVPHVAALVLTSVRANQNQSLRACIWWSAGIRAFPDAYKRDGRQFFKHGIRMRKRHLRVA